MVRRVSIALAGAALIAVPVTAQPPAITLQPGETLLSVHAVGRAQYVPDVATISVGVVSTGTTAREATDANAKLMAAVIAAIRKTGIDARQIRTQQIAVQPRFARTSAADYQGQAEISGYVANNSVVVTIDRPDGASDVITAAFGAGANSVSGPNLTSSNPDVGGPAARAQAIANARKEADEYAAALGLRVVRVIRAAEPSNQSNYESFASPPPPPAPLVASRVATPVNAGALTRSTAIWVDFALAK